ncbi:MAG: hypothetical protein NXI10_04120 [bacterium]|nr:hypothetical protein [bacterium]
MKVLLLLGILSLPAGLLAQNYDQRLLSSYDASSLENLEANDPQKLELLTYALENGMYFTDQIGSKGIQLSEIDVPENATSFVDMGLKITEQNQYFKVKGEDRMLVVKSFWVLNHELKNK